jgi:hypothetical protein
VLPAAPPLLPLETVFACVERIPSSETKTLLALRLVDRSLCHEVNRLHPALLETAAGSAALGFVKQRSAQALHPAARSVIQRVSTMRLMFDSRTLPALKKESHWSRIGDVLMEARLLHTVRIGLTADAVALMTRNRPLRGRREYVYMFSGQFFSQLGTAPEFKLQSKPTQTLLSDCVAASRKRGCQVTASIARRSDDGPAWSIQARAIVLL